jgi:hypothetical protein
MSIGTDADCHHLKFPRFSLWVKSAFPKTTTGTGAGGAF